MSVATETYDGPAVRCCARCGFQKMFDRPCARCGFMANAPRGLGFVRRHPLLEGTLVLGLGLVVVVAVWALAAWGALWFWSAV